MGTQRKEGRYLYLLIIGAVIGLFVQIRPILADDTQEVWIQGKPYTTDGGGHWWNNGGGRAYELE
jgi:hypothetical protein